MVAIKVTPREGPTTCLYCQDDLGPGGVACPACGVRYHDECALTFERCGTLGCKARLSVSSEPARPLPRLTAIAPRLVTLAAAPVEGDDDWVVALLPGSGDDPARAAFVGNLLGATAFDGRSRVVSPVPEPLVRVSGQAAAAGIVARLADRGLCAVALPAGAFLRPLLSVAATDVEPLAVPLRCRTASGREVAFPAPPDRLVVTAQLVEERPRAESAKADDGRPKTVRRLQRKAEHAALVFGRHDPDPILLGRDRTRVHGFRDPTAIGRFRLLLESLGRGATVVDLKGSSSPVLLVRRRPIVDESTENLAGVLLAARLLHAAWRAGASP